MSRTHIIGLTALGLAALALKNWLDARRVVPPAAARRLSVDGLRLYVIDEGPRPAPELVLLHGSAGSCWSFERLIPLLSSDYRVVVPERPGQGWSGQPRSYRLRDMTETVYRALRALDVERPVLVGVSYGGGVAMRMAADHPEFPSGMLLLASDGPSFTLEGHSQERAMRLASTILASPLLGPALAWTVIPPIIRLAFEQPLRDKFGPDRQLLDDSYARRAKDIYTRPSIILAAAREWRWEGEDIVELERDLGSIRIPTLVVRAGLDAFVPPQVAAATVAAIAGSRLVELPDAPHGFPESRPEATAALIREFVAGL